MEERNFQPLTEDLKTNSELTAKTDKKLPLLFTPLKIRGLEIKNRIMVSPMCQYSSRDGLLNDWHLKHLGGFARGGAGLICIEATGVTPNGLICPHDSGIWDDKHIAPIKRVVDFCHQHKALVGIQLAHAGRKASTRPPGAPAGSLPALPDEEGGWTPVAPSAIAFHESFRQPVALTKDGIKDLIKAWADAAIRANKAGIDFVEIHGAHGYLIHSFLSPLSNIRTDEYGGSFEGRTRFLLEVAKAVRTVWPKEKPLFVRLSCTDWVEGGWNPDETARVSILLKELGVDALDCSSGGGTLYAKIPVAPGYQVPFSEKVRRESGILTCAVGLLTDPHQVEDILQQGQADIIAIGREFLRNPNWPIDAARELGVDVERALHDGKLNPRM